MRSVERMVKSLLMIYFTAMISAAIIVDQAELIVADSLLGILLGVGRGLRIVIRPRCYAQ